MNKLFLYFHVQEYDDYANHEYSNEVHHENEEESEVEEKHEFEYLSEILETIYFLVDVLFHLQTEAGIRRLEADLADANVKLDQISAANGISGKRNPLKRHSTLEDIWRNIRQMAVIGVKLLKMFSRRPNDLNNELAWHSMVRLISLILALGPFNDHIAA